MAYEYKGIGFSDEDVQSIDNYFADGSLTTTITLKDGTTLSGGTNLPVATLDSTGKIPSAQLPDTVATAYAHSQAAHAPSNAERNIIIGLQKNGVDVSVDSTTRKANITVPTKTSDLTNDSDFITSSDLPEGVSASNTTPKVAGTAAVGTETAFARGDHVHPAQTSVSGNAGTATTLATSRTIDGVSFNGSAAITHYGTCSTSGSTAAKTVSCTGFNLVIGARIIVKFSNTNTNSSPTLNVNSTGAKTITYLGSTIETYRLLAGGVYEFVYDGTYYQLIGNKSVYQRGEAFIRFTEGTQICWGTYNVSNSSQTITYTASFGKNTTPLVFVQAMGTPCGSGYTNTLSVESATNTNFILRKEFSETKTIAYVAFGTWRAS